MPIIRIVKMTFEPECVAEFLSIFELKKHGISAFEGCLGVKLLAAGTTYFTYSSWDSEQALESYRQSPFFRETWAAVRVLFAAPPEAWTTVEVAA